MSESFKLITLRLGVTGQAVSRWQELLELEPTGVFDADTKAATSAWQRQRGLNPDGEVGPMTWGAAGFIDTTLHTEDIDEAFFPALRKECEALGARPRDMLSVIFSESGCRAGAHNNGPPGAPYEQQYHASGIIQFMPPTLKGLGWVAGHEAFRTLSATAQLPWLGRYFRPYRGHLGSVGGIYVATFLPALVVHAGDPTFVLTAKAGPLPWAYAPNSVFDANKDLAITVGELEAAVARNCVGPRWLELLARLSATDPETQPELPDLAPDSAPEEGTIHVLPDMLDAWRRRDEP